MEEGHQFVMMLQSVIDLGVVVTKIELGLLDRDSVNMLVSQKLKLLPRVTLPLAEAIYHKTKGLPIFVEQLMLEVRY